MTTEERRIDPLLAPVLRAESEGERQHAVTELLSEHVYERIDKILAARFRQSSLAADQRDDIRNEIIVRLVNRLRRLFDDPAGQTIDSFRDYVASVAFNTFDDFIRRAFPLRTKLKNRIRYVATHEPLLAIWESGQSLVCGLAEWRGQPPRAWTPERTIDLALPSDPADLRAALLQLFDGVGEPLAVEQTVSILATRYGYPEHEAPRALDDHAAAAGPAPGAGLESLQYLRYLWDEIRALPVRQRIALLLHARDADGESVARLLPLARVAAIPAIAATLEIAAEELAALWRRLPLDDLTIAERLGVTRQQVITLRRSARDRLARRMRARDEGRTLR